MDFVGRLSATEFFTLYGVLVGAAIVVTVLAWRAAKRKADAEAPLTDWDGYDVAFLAGGYERVAQAALASLVSRGALRLQTVEYRAVVESDLPADAHPVEQAVYAAVLKSAGAYLPGFAPQVRVLILRRAQRLKAQGLFVSGAAARVAGAISAVGWGLPGVLVVMRAFPRLNTYPGNTDPTGQTQVLCVCFAFHLVACLIAAGAMSPDDDSRWIRNQRGDRLLAEAREALAVLCPAGQGPPPDLSGMDLVASVGLFGLERWRSGPLAELLVALTGPPPSE